MDKIVVYQIFTRLFCNSHQTSVQGGGIDENGSGKLENITDSVLDTISQSGVTHIWFTGLLAHATCTDYSRYGITGVTPNTVKGLAGSPYAIRDYYDTDPDLAVRVPSRMRELGALVKRVHSHGMKVIMDFVPNHLARQYKSDKRPKGVSDFGEHDNCEVRFDAQNNFYYCPGEKLGGEVDWGDYTEQPARATGNDCFHACPRLFDWYETVKLNYGVDWEGGHAQHFSPIPDTWKKMLDILLFWSKKGIDGFRCDMAEMVPVEFWHWAINRVKDKYPEMLFIAEIYNPGSYTSYIEYGGFDYLYDKVGLYDTLRAITCGHESATAITRCWQNTGHNGPHMFHFMENHDEQRVASDFFAGSGRRGVPAMVVSATIDTCPVMLYAGQELGERGMDAEGFSGRDGRTTIFDYWNPDTLGRWYKSGTLSDTYLTEEEVSLKQLYSKLLNMARTEKAISSGKFFDLMYVNPESEKFNPHRQYAFMRQAEDEVLLIVVNFDDKPLNRDVFIPEHAFSYLNMEKRGVTEVTELLSGSKQMVELHPDCTIKLTVPPLSASILKL